MPFFCCCDRWRCCNISQHEKVGLDGRPSYVYNPGEFLVASLNFIFLHLHVDIYTADTSYLYSPIKLVNISPHLIITHICTYTYSERVALTFPAIHDPYVFPLCFSPPQRLKNLAMTNSTALLSNARHPPANRSLPHALEKGPLQGSSLRSFAVYPHFQACHLPLHLQPGGLDPKKIAFRRREIPYTPR